MAKFILVLDSGNAAFSGDGAQFETARLLKNTAERVEAGHNCGVLMDVNGNRCGMWDFEPTPEWRCSDCGTESIEEAEGQTCQECGRGMIKEND